MAPSIDYHKETVVKLRELLKTRGIPLTGLTRKAQLIAALEADGEQVSTQQAVARVKRKHGKNRDDDEQGQPRPRIRKSRNHYMMKSTELDVENLHKATLIPTLEQWNSEKDERKCAEKEERAEGQHHAEELAEKLARHGDEAEHQRKEPNRERKVERTRKEEMKVSIRSHSTKMWSNTFQADASRKSFTDIPWELRSQIYKYAMFDLQLTDGFRVITDWFWNIYYDPDRDDGPSADVLRFLAMMDTLGAMSKQIREESRAIFYGHANWKLADNKYSDRGRKSHDIDSDRGEDDSTESTEDDARLGTDYTTLVERFLDKVGETGRNELRCLDVRFGRLDLSVQGSSKFNQILSWLAQCKLLREVFITAHLSYIFRSDRDALEAYFLRGRRFHSPSLGRLSNVLRSLECLKELHVNMSRWYQDVCFSGCVKEDDPFLSFAFSGVRAAFLWKEVRDCLNKALSNRGIKVIVWIPKPNTRLTEPSCPDELNYKTWLTAYMATRGSGADSQAQAQAV